MCEEKCDDCGRIVTAPIGMIIYSDWCCCEERELEGARGSGEFGRSPIKLPSSSKSLPQCSICQTRCELVKEIICLREENKQQAEQIAKLREAEFIEKDDYDEYHGRNKISNVQVSMTGEEKDD